jgi:plastocyanin
MTYNSPHKLIHMAILLVFGLLLAACGGAADGTETPAAPAPTETSAPTQTSAPTAAPTATDEAPAPTESDDEDSDSGGETLVVEISSSTFNPGTATVKVGTTVTWVHRDGIASHTVTADDDSFTSGLMTNNNRFSFTFDTPGTYAYHCEFHGGSGGAGMSGVITVEE